MKKVIKISIIILLLNLPLQLKAEESVRAKEEKVIVVASRIPVKEMDIGRDVIIVTKEEIEKLPVRTVQELLKYFLDFQERESFGVQADVSIRGSTFQQVLVLLDGVRINDLQTAHHNMDIPVPLESIERIEILNGNGSSLFGADAFGGVINIVTKDPNKSRMYGRFGFYGHKTFSNNIGFEIKKEDISNILSFERNTSSGFMEDRDFSTFSIHEKLSWEKASKKFTFLTSHGEKDFGAYDFYTPGMNYPSRESTRTDLISTGYEGDFKKLQLVFHINYRSHFDRFILDKNRPGLYTNETRNRNLSSDFLLRVGNIAFGGEIAREYFTSLKSGTYSHFRSAIFGEYKKNIKKRILANFGLRLDYHSLYSSFFSPDICLTFLISNDFKIRTSMGKSFRAPSYTELYYKDPVNIGNPELKPERSSSYEFGFDYSIQKIFEAKLSLFQRDEKDLIDWIKREKKWYAENIRSRRVKGIEIDLRKKFRYAGFALKSSFFKTKENQSELIYKYSFRIPENQTTFSVEINPLHSLFLGLNFLYKKRANEKSYTLIDAKFSKKIGSFEIFLEGKNLLNVRYEEIKGVPMPGRWIGGGISVKT